mmetsp:Transcript_4318/g.12184  ORF Transcript_4318/g.12184 Transcript_4318/m.12184 type:complete len:89 (+) Transcript_4318:469-735(+)
MAFTRANDVYYSTLYQSRGEIVLEMKKPITLHEHYMNILEATTMALMTNPPPKKGAELESPRFSGTSIPSEVSMPSALCGRGPSLNSV